MSYKESLEAAGAHVIEYQEFGSWQGQWVAIVNWNGKTQIISDWYGSCSGCDAFLADFGWGAEEQPDYQERLAEFGSRYLNNPDTYDERLKKAKEDAEWDSDSEKIVAFLEQNKNLFI